MKLRNKKTGEVVELKLIQVNDKYLEDHEVDSLNGEKLTLKLLVNSFDDAKEPLIKDEKIRKVVREWAKLNCSYGLHQHNNYQLEDDNNYMIEFADDCFTNLELGKNYTITELCGEEEE